MKKSIPIKPVIGKIKTNIINYGKENVLFLVFVIVSIINTTLLRFLTVKNYNAIYPVLADLSVILIIGAIGYLFKKNHRFIYYFLWTCFMTLLCIINSMYYTNYISFASFSLLTTSLQVIDVGDAIVEQIMELKDFSYLWAVFSMIFLNSFLKKKGYYKEKKKAKNAKIYFINTLIVALIVLGSFISGLTGTDISRLNKQWSREYVVIKFGIITYQVNDLVASVRSQLRPLFGYDEAAKAFREYYDVKENNKTKNKYTDIFKGRNVIAIHAESIQNFALGLKFNNQEVTPNLNRLANEGIYFSNFYAQESVGTSSDSEFTFNTSLMPATSGTVFVNYFDKEYVATPQLLTKMGYHTFSMHANKGNYWNRSVVHPKLGYQNYYYYTKDYEIDEVLGLGLSDKSFFRQSVDKIKTISETHDKFYGTLIMLTNHTPFDAANNSEFRVDYQYYGYNEETDSYEDMVDPFLEGMSLGNYIKSVNYADEAIGEFITSLDEQGLLDNTVVIIYGDHDAKIKRSQYEYYYNYDYKLGRALAKDEEGYDPFTFYEYEINRSVPFIIWTKERKLKKVVPEVMGMIDVMPTLGNMFGFSNEYALGKDIFSIEKNVVVFPDGNWLTNEMYYDNQREEAIMFDSLSPVSISQIEENSQHAEDLISISNNIIVYDLIKRTKETEKILKGVE